MIESKVDKKGRIVIPKDIREELRLDSEDSVIFVREVIGYTIIPKEKYENPTESLKKIAVKGSGHPNPKKEIREWVASSIVK